SVSGTSYATFGTRLASNACVRYHSAIPARTNPSRTPNTGHGAIARTAEASMLCISVEHARDQENATARSAVGRIGSGYAEHRTELCVDRGHEGVAFASCFTSGADFDGIADRNPGLDRTVHGDLAAEVFLEAFDGLDHPCFGCALGHVVRRIVIKLL